MTFKVPDCGEFALFVGGVDMRIGADMLHSCTVIENSHMSVPSVNMTFVDDKKSAMSFGAFADGAPLDIILGDGKGPTNKYKFRSYSITQATTNSAGNVITVNGVADIVPWFTKTVDRNFKMPASDVVKQLASQAGMLTDIDSTSDHMNWLPDNRTFSQFARKVIDHAWMGEGASPLLAVTSQNGQWMARVKDILKTPQSGNKFISMGLKRFISDNDFQILDYKITTKSGPANNFVNYGHQVIQESLTGEVDIFSKMNLAKIMSSLGINSSLQSAVGTALNTFLPPSVGNTHKYYAKAKHNNTKARASFTTDLYITTDKLTPYKLLDDAAVILAQFDGDVDTAFSGNYKVSAISRHISKGNYVEKFELTSQGQNVDVFGIGL